MEEERFFWGADYIEVKKQLDYMDIVFNYFTIEDT
jgi:hypothetical protein